MITWTIPNQYMDLPTPLSGKRKIFGNSPYASQGYAGEERDEHDCETIDARSDNNGEDPGPQDFVPQGAESAHPDPPEDQFMGKKISRVVPERRLRPGRR
jgi:hypothetical protein